MKTVLVAGASGLVGKAVVGLLKQQGFAVHTLSNSLSTDMSKQRFNWSPGTGKIDMRCFDQVDYIINLSGAGLFDHRWTKAYRKKIIDSRTQSTALLASMILQHNYPIQAFVNASATGIYGVDTGENWVDETSAVGQDFLANVVMQWEESLLQVAELKTRKVCLRFGIVLSDQGGALTQMGLPVKYGVGSPFGSGKQYISWIHIDDLAHMILFALEKEEVKGVYNAVAPLPVTNAEMIQGIAGWLQKKLWAPAIPGIVLKLMLGSERAATLLGGNRVKNLKIEAAGFKFRYKTLSEALHSFFSSKNNV